MSISIPCLTPTRHAECSRFVLSEKITPQMSGREKAEELIDRWTFFPWFSPLFEPLLYWLFLSQKTTETHPYCSCHLLKGKMSPAVALSPHNNALMCPLGFQRMPRKELRRLKASFTTFLFHVDVMWHESRTNTRSCLLYLSWCLQLVTVADKSREKNAKERHTRPFVTISFTFPVIS